MRLTFFHVTAPRSSLSPLLWKGARKTDIYLVELDGR